MKLSRKALDVVVVTLLTPLIWLYAEAQRTTEYTPTYPVPLDVQVGDGYVLTNEPPERLREIRFRGTQMQIDRLKRRLSAEGLTYRFSGTASREVRLKEALADAEPVRSLGVTVVEVDPAVIKVAVDRVVKVEADLRFTPESLQLEKGPQIKPGRVTVRMPKGLKKAEVGERRPTFPVEPKQSLEKLSPGGGHEVSARVVLPPSLADHPNVSVTPSTVTVAFSILRREESITLRSVPVWIQAPPSELDDFRVKLKDGSQFIQDVTIRGPSKLIKKIREGQRPVVAVFRLGRNQMETGVNREPVSFDLPPGLTAESEVDTVWFTVEPRSE